MKPLKQHIIENLNESSTKNLNYDSLYDFIESIEEFTGSKKFIKYLEKIADTYNIIDVIGSGFGNKESIFINEITKDIETSWKEISEKSSGNMDATLYKLPKGQYVVVLDIDDDNEYLLLNLSKH